MPRPKGSKNKKRTQPRIKFEISSVLLLQKLSEDSGLPFNKVLDDAIVEGAAELRDETYAGLIDFNLNRRGKVIHERESKKVGRQGAREHSEPSLEEGAGTDQDRRDSTDEQPGYEGQTSEDSGLLGRENRSGQYGALDGPPSDDFQRRARETIEHIENHPPFTVPSEPRI